MKYFGMKSGYESQQGPDVFNVPTSHDGGVFSQHTAPKKKQPEQSSLASSGTDVPIDTKDAA